MDSTEYHQYWGNMDPTYFKCWVCQEVNQKKGMKSITLFKYVKITIKIPVYMLSSLWSPLLVNNNYVIELIKSSNFIACPMYVLRAHTHTEIDLCSFKRNRAQILLTQIPCYDIQIQVYTYIRVYRDRLVWFRKDMGPNPSHSNTMLRHSNKKFIPLKLIFII